LVQQEIEKKKAAGDLSSVARLLNQDNIMKQEISVLQREERDIKDPKKFRADVRELTELFNTF